MENRILGLHHITAIAGNAQRNYDFYTKVLGLRMVKKTVNFDDPKTYHFYFGDGLGSPGSILTFFPWPGAGKGTNGAGMATNIGYSVPKGSLEFWKEGFEKFNVPHGEISEKFGEEYLPFQDLDGLELELIVPGHNDIREPWTSQQIIKTNGLKGFHNVTLTLNDIKATALILIDIFGYRFVTHENDLHRFRTDAIENAAIVDLFEVLQAPPGVNAVGTNHHIAFRVEDEKTLMHYREKVLRKGHQITEKINRDYFFSVYFREPGGVLFEIATDSPGFATDETVEELGSSLQLPKQYEAARTQIEQLLPSLRTS